jgi:hypothetical protein
MSALDRISERLESMDTFWIAQYQVLDAMVEQANINVERYLRYLAPKDQED